MGELKISHAVWGGQKSLKKKTKLKKNKNLKLRKIFAEIKCEEILIGNEIGKGF